MDTNTFTTAEREARKTAEWIYARLDGDPRRIERRLVFLTNQKAYSPCFLDMIRAEIERLLTNKEDEQR